MPYTDIFSREVFELALSMPDKHPEPFLALEEYDRTRKLKKWNSKIRANFTLDAATFQKLRKYCQEKGYKMSSFLDRAISLMINDKGRKF